MNLRQIEIFVEVMRTGSVTKGAQALNISQPAVSKALAYTEDRLGLKLFKRLSGRLVPTPEAIALYREAEQVIFSLDRFKDFSRDVTALKNTHLTIHSEHLIGLTVLPQAIAQFRENHPDIRLEFEVHRPIRIVNAIKRRQADLGLIHFPTRDAEIEAEILRKGRIVCAMHRDHPLAGRASISAQNLRDTPVIYCHGGVWLKKALEPILFQKDSPIQPGIKVNDSALGCVLSQLGQGAILVDDLMQYGSSWPDLVFRPFETTIEVAIGAIYRQQEPLSLQAELFLKQLRQTMIELETT